MHLYAFVSNLRTLHSRLPGGSGSATLRAPCLAWVLLLCNSHLCITPLTTAPLLPCGLSSLQLQARTDKARLINWSFQGKGPLHLLQMPPITCHRRLCAHGGSKGEGGNAFGLACARKWRLARVPPPHPSPPVHPFDLHPLQYPSRSKRVLCTTKLALRVVVLASGGRFRSKFC